MNWRRFGRRRNAVPDSGPRLFGSAEIHRRCGMMSWKDRYFGSFMDHDAPAVAVQVAPNDGWSLIWFLCEDHVPDFERRFPRDAESPYLSPFLAMTRLESDCATCGAPATHFTMLQKDPSIWKAEEAVFVCAAHADDEWGVSEKRRQELQARRQNP